ncbi:hypothetical protein BGZ60DRAFT_38520 [Tricladium varicosporioides]|nr:hypothetical protein BGZ60DRAFT_38520 [Hymenoscyphus varicosporioides]
MFMGTPHQGGEGVAWGKRLINVASIFVNTNNKLLNILENESEFLQQQLGQYNSISGDFETKFAYETKPTPLVLGKAILVVPKSSAVIPGQVDAEPIAIMDHHINMVKFAKQSNEFKKVAGHLKLMVDNAPLKIEKNWVTERGVEVTRAGNTKPTFDVAFDLTGVPTTGAFIGRRSDLDSIEKQLTPGEVRDRRKVCVVHGLGGVGKTQLAIEYARLHKGLYTSFFWIDGKTEESLIQSLLNIALRLPNGQILGIDTQKIGGLEKSRKAAQKILEWFALSNNTQWLLVFDNIDKTSYGEKPDQNTEPSSYDITQYLPRGDTGSIIVTTRLQRLVSLGGAVPLRKLGVLDGLLVLESYTRRILRCSSRQMVPGDMSEIDNWDPDAVTLVKRLDCLPLALVFAGSYISTTTVAKYLELYKNSWQDLHRQMRKCTDYPETIITTWQISFDEVERRDKGAANLLRLWGYLDNQDLWYQLLLWRGYGDAAPRWLQQIVNTEISFLATITTLLDFSLIERNNNSESYSMHPVVHDWVQSMINIRKDDGFLQVAITTIGLAVPVHNKPDSPSVKRRISPHSIQLIQCWSLASIFQDFVDTPAFLEGLNCLGILYWNQGKLSEAEEMYQRALKGRYKALGSEHTSTLETINNIGVLYHDQGKLPEAEEMYQRALKGSEKAFGAEHTSTLDTINNLGILYWNQGKLSKAEEMLQRALKGRYKALESEHTSTLETINNLGTLYWNQGKLSEAEEMYQRALKGKEKALGAEHTSTLGTINNIGILYWNQGKLSKAEEMLQRALKGSEKALGSEHTSTLGTINNIGVLYHDQGKLPEAEEMLQRALKGSEKALGSEHTSTLNTINNLGILYQDQGRLSEAEEMLRRALKGRYKALGSEHISTLDTINNLGILYRDQGKLSEAEEMFQRALRGDEKNQTKSF